MKLLYAGVAALNQTPFDWTGNQRRIVAAIEAARAASVTVLCLPELCITGYGCEDIFYAPSLHRRALEALTRTIAPATEDMIVSVGLPLYHQGALYNAAAMIADRRILGFTAKQFLAGDGIHYEPRWFKPWPAGARSEVDVLGDPLPLGDLFYDLGGIRFGFEVCEDAWVADRPGRRLAALGVDVILNPSASHFSFDKQEIRRRFVLEGSRAFGAAYLYANLLGNEAGRAIYDGGTMIAQTGRMLIEGERFSFDEVKLTTAVLDIDLTRSMRSRLPSFRPSATTPPEAGISGNFTFPEIEPLPPAGRLHAFEASDHLKEEEFSRAVALALFDYLRKSWSRGYVVSLSGGADSAACAALVAIMVRLGTSELSVDGFRERLRYAGLVGETAEQLTGELLWTAYQSTAHSSDVTRAAAREVAAALGATHHELDVDPIVNGYRSIIEGALGRQLSWDTDDIALQNIQARARGPSIWMLTNLSQKLLIATSNRSEAAVGYTTMDGDTCGGLSPIAGIDKAFLRDWLRWLEAEGPCELGPLPAMRAINAQEPTAELRPESAHQTDEKDLMPYPILDAIERLAIRDKKEPLACFRILRARFKDVDPEQLRGWVVRFFQLWCRNQWKRERYAPSFHLDDENLDPKTWCRFPILSGGFTSELAELEAASLHSAGGDET